MCVMIDTPRQPLYTRADVLLSTGPMHERRVHECPTR
jgi:hypothetical protein